MPRINISQKNYDKLSEMKKECNQYRRRGKYTMDDVLTDILAGEMNSVEVGIMCHPPRCTIKS